MFLSEIFPNIDFVIQHNKEYCGKWVVMQSMVAQFLTARKQGRGLDCYPRIKRGMSIGLGQGGLRI